MFGIASRNPAHSVGQFPGDKQAALAADLHAFESLIPSGNKPAHALGKAEGLGFAEDWLAVGVFLRLAVFVHDGSAVVEGGVELAAVRDQPACVVHFVQLVGLCLGAGTDLDVFVAEGEGWFHDCLHGWNAGR